MSDRVASDGSFWDAWSEPPAFLGPITTETVCDPRAQGVVPAELEPITYIVLGIGIGVALTASVVASAMRGWLRTVERLDALEPPLPETRR